MPACLSETQSQRLTCILSASPLDVLSLAPFLAWLHAHRLQHSSKQLTTTLLQNISAVLFTSLYVIPVHIQGVLYLSLLISDTVFSYQ